MNDFSSNGPHTKSSALRNSWVFSLMCIVLAIPPLLLEAYISWENADASHVALTDPSRAIEAICILSAGGFIILSIISALLAYVPFRRWFKFSLSTWIVLLAFASWVLSLRPSLDYGHLGQAAHGPSGGASIGYLVDYVPGTQWYAAPVADNLCFDFTIFINPIAHVYWITITPRSLAWPALALSTFFTGKVLWVVLQNYLTRRSAQW